MFQVLNVLNTDILHTTLPQIYVAGTSPYFLTAPLVSRSRPLTGWKTRQLIVLSSNDFPHSQWSTYDGLQLMNKQRRRNNRERRKRRRSQSHFTVPPGTSTHVFFYLLCIYNPPDFEVYFPRPPLSPSHLQPPTLGLGSSPLSQPSSIPTLLLQGTAQASEHLRRGHLNKALPRYCPGGGRA